MSAPGWYPDPAGVPNRLRYWDGKSWTTQINDTDAAGPSAEDPKRGVGGIVAAVAGAVVLVLVAVMALWNPFADNGEWAAPAATSSPTISPWNESETPTPTPTPTPSKPSPSITNLRCDEDATPRSVNMSVSGGRLIVGHLSMPTLSSDWEGPAAEPMVRYAEGAYGYLHDIEPNWLNTMIIGPTNFAQPVSLETQARTIIACLAGTDYLSRYKAPDTLKMTSITVSGKPAIQADAAYSWDDSDLESKGSLIRVVVVQTSDGPYMFFGEATKERPDMIQVMNKLSSGLSAS